MNETSLRPLHLTTRPASFAGRSGYPLLSEYLPEAEVIKTQRRDPVRWTSRMCARVARRMAFSRWYLGGSAAMEWQGFRKLRVDGRRLVHIFWGDFDLGFLDIYTRSAGIPLCATFHHCADTIAGVIRFPRRLRQLDAIILMSETQRPFMLEAGVSPERIHVVYHGVDTCYFTPFPRLGPFRVLAVGGYRRDFQSLRAICERLAKVGGVQVQIVGPAAAASEFMGLPNVQYDSGLTDDQLLQSYRSASCFLMAVENATANNALLEAMACGLPIVGSAVGGIAEYAIEGTGILTSPCRPEETVDVVHTLMADPDLRDRMGKAARKRAEELDWKRVADRTREVYTQAAREYCEHNYTLALSRN